MLRFKFNGKNLMPNDRKKHASIHATISAFLRMKLLLLSHLDIKMQDENERFIPVSHHHCVQDNSIIELSFDLINIPLSK